MVGAEERERFCRICRDMLTVSPAVPGGDGVGIGTYNEKRMHAALKRFICEDISKHEIDMGNRMIADVDMDGEIYEVQTGSLFPMKKKLDYYLSATDRHITAVYPVPARRYLVWIDPVSGEASPRRSSPRRPGAAQTLPELIYVADYIATGRVSVRLLLVEEEEYRFLDGCGKDKKKRSSRFERLPVDLIDDVTLSSVSDFAALVPQELPFEFTASEFARALGGVRGRKVYMALGALTIVGALVREGARGRASLWHRVKIMQ